MQTLRISEMCSLWDRLNFNLFKDKDVAKPGSSRRGMNIKSIDNTVRKRERAKED
jgi:hypothetical protein